jgi:hypothetical protein
MSYLNPIETAFGYIKRHYYTQRLRIGAQPEFSDTGKNLNPIIIDQLIEDSINRYKDMCFIKVITSCMRKWLEKLNEPKKNE